MRVRDSLRPPSRPTQPGRPYRAEVHGEVDHTPTSPQGPTCHACPQPPQALVRQAGGVILEVCSTHNTGDVELVATVTAR